MKLLQRKKLSKADKERQKRLKRSLKASTQNSIYYQSLFENGLMHIAKNEWSRTYRLGDVAYTSANQLDKEMVIDSYAEALNSLDAGNNFQLLVINRRIESNALDKILYEKTGDAYDVYRQEYNAIIQSRFSADSRNFKTEKYVTLSTTSYDQIQADTQLHELGDGVANQFEEMSIAFEPLDGLERLRLFSWFLRHSPYLPYTYQDIALSGLRTKDFIAPNRLLFREDSMRIDERFAQVLYVRHYPTFLTDKLIKELTSLGIELAITVQANPYNPGDFAQQLIDQQAGVKREMVKNQKDGISQGIIDPDLAVSGVAREINETTKRWQEETTENDQKAFAGLIAVYLVADSQEDFTLCVDRVKGAGRKLGVLFDSCYYYQEQALNTLLPIGHTFLDVKQDFIRPMTTANVATQVPFTNVDIQSQSSKALYYGQNQLSHNIITLDRKDLNTASGLVIGSSGSGKGGTVKTTEIIPTLLKHPEDITFIIDPEGEYLKIGKAFDGQIIHIHPKTSTHLNLLDLPKTDEVLFDDEGEEIDPIADKANLLMGLFEAILKEMSDNDIGIIDRVTKLVYQQYEQPTLLDWQTVLEEQDSQTAKDLAEKLETYTTGSLNLFSHQTNVDLTKNLVIFNLKGLSNKLKPFALMVLQDYVWQQLIARQGKQTLRLYWDELHICFRTPRDTVFFAELWARIRKYGAIVTGITQNIGTILQSEEGRNMVSNTAFLLLLKHGERDLEALRTVLSISPTLEKYILRPKKTGSGLVVAEGTIVPFENTIPKDTQLFDLMMTDA